MFLSGIYVTFCNLMFKIAFLGKLKLTLDLHKKDLKRYR